MLSLKNVIRGGKENLEMKKHGRKGTKQNQTKRSPSMLPEKQEQRKKLFQYKELVSQPSTSGLEI